ncbi:MAG: alpha/beta hydrolase [Rhodospirillaceae bacterium]|nr:alpha/beta hydrolase [Rhodospirillaceae bacterium]
MEVQAIYEGYDETDLEQQYNLRPRHPERDLVYARYAAASSELRAEANGRYDVRYGTAERQVMDILSAGAGAPVLVFFHGGYWRALDKSIFSCIAAPYLRAGWTVALPNYTLAPAAPIDEIVEEARQAVAWVANELLPDGGPLVLSGHSAGAQLAVMAMLADWRARGFARSPIMGGIPVSGLFDLEPICHTSINNLVRLQPADAIRNSPAHLAVPGAGPLLLMVGSGETEEFHGQTERFAEIWRASGNSTQTVIADGHTHFSILGAFGEANDPLCARVLEFLMDCTDDRVRHG